MAEGVAKTAVDAGPARLLDWEEAFLDATFITAKKGAPQSVKHVAGKVRSAWWWSTATAYLSERTCVRAVGRLTESTLAQVKVPRKGCRRPRSYLKRVIADRRLRFRRLEDAAPQTANRADCSQPEEHPPDSRTNASCVAAASAGKSRVPTPGCKTSVASRCVTTASLPCFRASSTAPASSSLSGIYATGSSALKAGAHSALTIRTWRFLINRGKEPEKPRSITTPRVGRLVGRSPPTDTDICLAW